MGRGNGCLSSASTSKLTTAEVLTALLQIKSGVLSKIGALYPSMCLHGECGLSRKCPWNNIQIVRVSLTVWVVDKTLILTYNCTDLEILWLKL